MPIFAFAPGVIRPGQFGAEQPHRFALQVAHHHRGVTHRDSFRDADDQRDARVGRFQDGVRRERRRHEDERNVRAGTVHGIAYAIEHGDAVQNGFPALARRHAGDEVGPVCLAALRVETPLTSRDALHQQARILVHQDAHVCLLRYPLMAAAASSSVSTIVAASPDSAIICFPSSTFVPSIRTTSGGWRSALP